MTLIPAPDLDLRNEEVLAAQALLYVSGGLRVDPMVRQIGVLGEEMEILRSGLPAPPICHELTNANASSPHTILLETIAWMMAQQARRINQLPVRDEIEFHRLFGVELRAATKATTVLTFTLAFVPPDTDVTIPAGTIVSTPDGLFSFATDEDLVIASQYGDQSGAVVASSTVAGATLLSANTLTKMTDVVAFVHSTPNPPAAHSHPAPDTIDQALQRARNYQRRGERLVSARA